MRVSAHVLTSKLSAIFRNNDPCNRIRNTSKRSKRCTIKLHGICCMSWLVGQYLVLCKWILYFDQTKRTKLIILPLFFSLFFFFSYIDFLYEVISTNEITFLKSMENESTAWPSQEELSRCFSVWRMEGELNTTKTWTKKNTHTPINLNTTSHFESVKLANELSFISKSPKLAQCTQY